MPSSNPPPEKLPLPRGQIVLRVCGGGLLTACALMVVLGTTALGGHLHGPRFLLYWTGCLLLTCAAILVALWDMLLVRRISRRTRRELFRRQFMSGNLADRLRDQDRWPATASPARRQSSTSQDSARGESTSNV